MVKDQGSVPCGLCFGHYSQLPKLVTKEDAFASMGFLLTSDNDHEQYHLIDITFVIGKDTNDQCTIICMIIQNTIS